MSHLRKFWTQFFPILAFNMCCYIRPMIGRCGATKYVNVEGCCCRSCPTFSSPYVIILVIFLIILTLRHHLRPFQRTCIKQGSKVSKMGITNTFLFLRVKVEFDRPTNQSLTHLQVGPMKATSQSTTSFPE
jgi:hypothetical protein